MQQELRFATFNVCNLALPGTKYYDDQEPYTAAEYDAKTTWIARQIDQLDADVIGFQEIFSQAALRNVLAKSQKYQRAHHIGFDPQTQAHQTPSVALISRLPILEGTAGVTLHTVLPHHLSIPLPGVDEPLTSFTRPVLHARLMMPADRIVNVFVCHLKSKRPDYRNGDNATDPDQVSMAILRSLIRRSTDAMGLRSLLTDCMLGNRGPIVVMGDFNDVADAVSTQLVMGAGDCGKNSLDDRLFDSNRVQSCKSLHDVGYSHVHEDTHETVDHVLVSREFNPESSFAIGEVLQVIHINDHVELKLPEATDHGLVLVRIKLREPDAGQAQASPYLASASPTTDATSGTGALPSATI